MELPVIQPWFSDGLRFECNGCGDCCSGESGFVWISDAEITLGAEFLKISAAEFTRRYCRKLFGRVALKEKRPNAKGEYDCIFLKTVPAQKTGGGKPALRRICEVYPVRPLQCRTFPFWEGHLENRRAWDGTISRCPGINVGKRWSPDQIVRLRDATEWPEEA